jgi:hypothetical protein
MAFGVDLNRPVGEGDGNGFLDMNEEPTGGEEQHQVASDICGVVFPFDLNFVQPEDQGHMQTCKNCSYQCFMWSSCLLGLAALLGL